jgi:hypothetical protein
LAAEETVSRLSGEYDLALANLDKALDLTRTFRSLTTFRRMSGVDESVHELAEPFDQLLDDSHTAILESIQRIPNWLEPQHESPVSVGAVIESNRTADLLGAILPPGRRGQLSKTDYLQGMIESSPRRTSRETGRICAGIHADMWRFGHERAVVPKMTGPRFELKDGPISVTPAAPGEPTRVFL